MLSSARASSRVRPGLLRRCDVSARTEKSASWGPPPGRNTRQRARQHLRATLKAQSKQE